MIRILTLMTSLFLFFLFQEDNISLVDVRKEIIGKWEFDYNQKDKTAVCDDGVVDYNFYKLKYGRTYIEFFENKKFHKVIWGHDTIGYYQLNGEQIILKDGMNRKIKDFGWRWKIEKISKDSMTISFVECDNKIIWSFLKSK